MALDAQSTSLTVSLSAQITKYITGLGPRVVTVGLNKSFSFTLGAGADAINEVYCAYRTLAASGTETLDLTALTGPHGDSLVFARIKAIGIWLLGTADQDVGSPAAAQVDGNACSQIVVGGAAANPWQAFFNTPATDKIKIASGGVFTLQERSATGWVTSGTNKNLLIANSDGAVEAHYILALLGAAT